MTTNEIIAPPSLASVRDKVKRRQPSKAAKARVREAFNPQALAAICVLDDFGNYARRVDLADGKFGRKRFYYYVDNGSDILGVAHLDSVQEDGICQITSTAAGLLATSGTLDDRLGAYVILELLPKLGIVCDWLLTTDEEIGQSTAEEFATHKSYHWMFQFDRGGTDVVMYEYENEELVELVEECGARVGLGSFSDICLLDHLGCAGFNWGVGYEDYHSARSHAWLEDTFRMVARFVKFYDTNATIFFPYDPYDDSRWEMVVVDCGHAVDMDDPNSYVETEGGTVIECAACGCPESANAQADAEWWESHLQRLDEKEVNES